MAVLHRVWAHRILLLIVLLAIVLRFYQLGGQGNNQYYLVAAKSMLASPSNFFFVASEPGGSVSVDKPPVALWVQALSVGVLGANSLAVALPQAIAGVLTVLLAYHLLARTYGTRAGLLAAAVAAFMPVAVAVERVNSLDPLLIVTLLLATWAFFRAGESGRWRPLLLGAALVGVGFNIKMMQAFLPVPAFYLYFFIAAPLSRLSRVVRLAVATAVLLAVCASWLLIVDATDPAQRPYVGGSTNNTVFNLVVAYNGAERLMGAQNPPGAAGQMPNGLTPPQGGNGQPPLGGNGQPPMGNGLPAGGSPLSFEVGEPGLLRLWQMPAAKNASWLLLFALLGGAWTWWRTRRPAVILWGGWLVTATVFFSIARFYHAYYLIMLATPIAALSAMALEQADQDMRAGRSMRGWLALGAVSIAYQAVSAVLMGASPLLGVGAVLLGIAAWLAFGRGRTAYTLAFFSLSLLLIPAVWSWWTAMDANLSAALPAAYAPAGAAMPAPPGSPSNSFAPTGGMPNLLAEMMNGYDVALTEYLQARTENVRYLLVVPTAQQAGGYILATGRPVFPAGGFNGQDPALPAEKAAQMVADGELRYFLGGSAPMGGFSAGLQAWLEAYCRVDEAAPLTEPPIPDALLSTLDSNAPPFSLKSVLYDCVPAV